MGNKSFDELISGYINNRLTEEELTLFLQEIQLQEHQGSLERKIEQLLTNEPITEFSDKNSASVIFQKVMDAAGKQEKSQEGDVIHLSQRRKQSSRIWMVAAASILLLIGLRWLFFADNKPERLVAVKKEKRNDGLSVVARNEVNTTDKEKRIELADGSLIILAPKSEITYHEPFADKRDIILLGKAFFKVAKSKTRPFTVFSGDISTTALGTKFTVTTFKNNNRVVVRLYEGKVVVKAVDKGNKKLKKDVYLLPGQAFVYQDRRVAMVRDFEIITSAQPEQIMNQERSLDNPSLPENEEHAYFMFNNQPLSQVLDDLAGIYDVKIVYDKKDVDNLYFIGKYKNTDSLETILKRIATLNNLLLERGENAYIIGKHK